MDTLEYAWVAHSGVFCNSIKIHNLKITNGASIVIREHSFIISATKDEGPMPYKIYRHDVDMRYLEVLIQRNLQRSLFVTPHTSISVG